MTRYATSEDAMYYWEEKKQPKKKEVPWMFQSDNKNNGGEFIQW
jgi:hypothetical protein